MEGWSMKKDILQRHLTTVSASCHVALETKGSYIKINSVILHSSHCCVDLASQWNLKSQADMGPGEHQVDAPWSMYHVCNQEM